jgi:hypothetical protein
MEYTLNKIDDYSRDIYNILTISSTVFKNNRNYFVCAINSLLNNIIIAAITLSLFIITDVDILQHTTFAQIKEMITRKKKESKRKKKKRKQKDTHPHWTERKKKNQCKKKKKKKKNEKFRVQIVLLSA